MKISAREAKTNIKCRIEGCIRNALYHEKALCQKHYFRFRRNGNYDLKPITHKEKIITPNGYIRIYSPNHPLGYNRSHVFEHRKVVYDIYGENLPPCQICGKKITWSDCHIDHIDKNRKNNSSDNLRPLCRSCNTNRDYPPQHTLPGKYALTVDGVTMTPNEWSRMPGVNVWHSTIIHRKRMGMSDYDAIYSPKKTHNGKK